MKSKNKVIYDVNFIKSIMTANYLHQRKDFLDLINLIADEKSIEPFLVEKDYWIM
jgi:hypothetical protein